MKLQKVGIFVVRRLLPALAVVLALAVLAFFMFFVSLAQRALKDSQKNLEKIVGNLS